MLKKIIRLVLLVAGGVCVSFFFLYERDLYLKESTIKSVNSQVGKNFIVSNNIERFVNSGLKHDYVIQYTRQTAKPEFKLVYEINFDCSVCMFNLIEIYKFYQELSNVHRLDFCLVTEQKSDSYIEYWLDQVLKEYDLLIIRQDIDLAGFNLYLLDSSNKIIMAGDIIKYPFLKQIYINKLTS